MLAYTERQFGHCEKCFWPGIGMHKKKIIKVFQQYGLNISANTNLVQTNFLDIMFNLKSGKYWPYCKPNDQPLYIHQQCNYPPTIKKQLPSMSVCLFSFLPNLPNLLPSLSLFYQTSVSSLLELQ